MISKKNNQTNDIKIHRINMFLSIYFMIYLLSFPIHAVGDVINKKNSTEEIEKLEELNLDEGFIMFSGEKQRPHFPKTEEIYLKVGKFDLPFGHFESSLLSDPVTVELGETRQAAVEMGGTAAGFHGTIYLFNGDHEKEGDNTHSDNFGVAAGYTRKTDDFKLEMGVGYINTLLNSEGWSELLGEKTADAETSGTSLSHRNEVAGINIYTVLNAGPFTLVGEYLAALDELEWNISDLNTGSMGIQEIEAEEIVSVENETAEIETVEIGNKPSVWHFELGYDFKFYEKESVVALSYQGTDNSADDFPKSRYAGVFSISLFENTTLALEYLTEMFENNDDVNRISSQLAIEF